MNWNLVGKTISDRWKNTAVYAAGLALYTLMLTAIFPSFMKIEGINELIEQYPKEIFELFGGAEFDFTSFSNYISVEFLGLIIIIIIGAYVFTFGRSMVAGEMKDGTLELLLAQPVARWRVLSSKAAVMLAGIVGLTAVTVLAVLAFGSAFDVGVSYRGFLAYWPLAVAMFIAIAGYTILLTVIVPRWGTMAAVGVTLAFYLLNFATKMVGSIDFMKYFSIFHYYDPNTVLNTGGVPVVHILVLTGFGVACFLVGLFIFQRKDVIL